MRRLVASLGGLLLSLALVAPAYAAEPDELLRKGSALRAEGRDADALKVFEEADAARPTATSKAQIGLAEQALGAWVRAEAHLEQALAQGADPWIVRNRQALEGALDTVRQHLGSLEILGAAEGAEVFVDGIKMGVMPAAKPFRVEIGKRQLELRREGFNSVSRTVVVGEGATSRETVTMTPRESHRPEGETFGTGGLGRGGAPVGDPPSAGGSSVARTVGWVLVGTGGAAAIFGGAGLLVRESATSNYNANQACGQTPLPPECQDQVSARDRWTVLSVASFIGAGVLIGTGVVLVVTAHEDKPKPSRGGLSFVGCSVPGPGITCGGRF
jgi:hypothetical protein